MLLESPFSPVTEARRSLKVSKFQGIPVINSVKNLCCWSAWLNDTIILLSAQSQTQASKRLGILTKGKVICVSDQIPHQWRKWKFVGGNSPQGDELEEWVAFPEPLKLYNIFKSLCWKQHLSKLNVLAKSHIQNQTKLYLHHKISFSSGLGELH